MSILRPYYTGATSFLAVQRDPSSSLGGYPSSVSVVNSIFGNLFGDISQMTLQRDFEGEVRCIALKNETGAELTSIALEATLPSGNIATYEYAAVAGTYDATCDEWLTESIQNPFSLPYTGAFASLTGSVDITPAGNLANNAYLFLWIRRIIDRTTALAAIACDQLNTNFTATPQVDLSLSEEVTLAFTYS